MNEQQQFWAQDYAEDYIRKNSQFDHQLGVEGWQKMLAASEGIQSVLECGCNIGRNIDFLSAALPGASKSIVEISKPAFDFVTRKHQLAHAFNGAIEASAFPDRFDLVFTIGVLIHIDPDNLLTVMKKMFDYSDKYILIGEYFNRTPVMIEYQGQQNKLFKRDFGKLFMESFPVELVDYGFLWGHVYDKAGFDDITWWLFRKH
ncbi:pseudaminic acid biosynthesis-associated methylase [Laribacter hongkongensis]|uniref:pseudaminic acid biosynthesis-associated methylase n=1 Tax=Laribacter hongkongensis TaxID=168471 RepID=UPI001EFC8929|nr:pseudaminic acid biosynthesis-associated methylase [Laribacter hongkongensis]MCG9042274.1 class I SAM-dependent methyltransferase [Laribacter hongkongensis]MCG9057162.1 class I SAM-dependent methyltransferase [Laribacter hongkongensis]MCG9069193.1 class I SAM-dependent methyltransferase [Laribacter hongkongensis]